MRSLALLVFLIPLSAALQVVANENDIVKGELIQAYQLKRSLCNTFGGCGSKRSFQGVASTSANTPDGSGGTNNFMLAQHQEGQANFLRPSGAVGGTVEQQQRLLSGSRAFGSPIGRQVNELEWNYRGSYAPQSGPEKGLREVYCPNCLLY